MRRARSQRDTLVANHVIFNIEVQLRLGGTSFGIVNLVALCRFASPLQGQIAFRGDDLHFLISVRVGVWDPNSNFFTSGKILDGEGVMKREVARILSSEGYNEGET